ncbi:MAG TPA: ABC transporter ATP-binding protein [Streptosporangiaceae bacterium]|nr:ABC transporter ATP-binding protein [Streptosporangiaceae bacterium]
MTRRDARLAPGTRFRRHARTIGTVASIVWSSSPGLVSTLTVICLGSGLIAPATAWLQRDLLDALVPLSLAAHRRPGAGQAPVPHSWLPGHDLLALVVGLGVLGVGAAVVPQVQQYIQLTMRRSVALVLSDRAYRAVSSWPGIARFESPAFADKLQLTNQLGQATAASLITTTLGCGQALVTAVTFLATLILINPVLAVVAAITQGLAIAANLSNARQQAFLQIENSARSRRQQSFSRLLNDAVAAKEVRLFALGDFLRGRMLAELSAIRISERALGRRLLRIESVFAVVTSTVIAGGLVWTVTQVARGQMPIGNVSLFVMAAVGMQAAMSQAAAALGGLTESVMLFGSYTDVVTAPPDLPVKIPPVPVPALADGITFDDVWFRYDESHSWVLRGVSMHFRAGSRVALVGLNGSGKSTLVKLLCRLYDPVKGSIRWDGVDIRDFDPVALRERIAGVFQDYMSYELTVTENIGMGDLRYAADADSIRRAAELAGADADISRLPDGYDTMLSRVFRSGGNANARAGVMLSGGQRQRLALARAFMRSDRDLLIVDEPMSSLDAQAEHEVNQRLAQVRAGRTCVLISHRLATVRPADDIFVLAKGIVAEQGTHAELMASGGHYARLFSMQAAGYSDVGAAGGAAASAEVTR